MTTILAILATLLPAHHPGPRTLARHTGIPHYHLQNRPGYAWAYTGHGTWPQGGSYTCRGTIVLKRHRWRWQDDWNCDLHVTLY